MAFVCRRFTVGVYGEFTVDFAVGIRTKYITFQCSAAFVNIFSAFKGRDLAGRVFNQVKWFAGGHFTGLSMQQLTAIKVH